MAQSSPGRWLAAAAAAATRVPCCSAAPLVLSWSRSSGASTTEVRGGGEGGKQTDQHPTSNKQAHTPLHSTQPGPPPKPTKPKPNPTKLTRRHRRRVGRRLRHAPVRVRLRRRLRLERLQVKVPEADALDVLIMALRQLARVVGGVGGGALADADLVDALREGREVGQEVLDDKLLVARLLRFGVCVGVCVCGWFGGRLVLL